MRTSMLLGAALAGFAAATPLSRRQGLDFDVIDAATPVEVISAPSDVTADPGNYDADAAVADASSDPVVDSSDSGNSTAKMIKRATECTALPVGYGPVSSPDDAATFLADSQYSKIANAAVLPPGYSLAFSNLQASTQTGGYITYKNLKQYDPLACQEFCDNTDSCYFFNLYMERDPTIAPGPDCLNPASLTYYKCALYGAQQTAATAKNKGQYRYNFQVAISGSNGYNKLAPPPPADGFQTPVSLAGSTNAPDNSYIGSKFFPGPYNAAQCTSACQATTAYDQAHPAADGSFDTCSFVNSYVLYKNGVSQGTYCGLYTKTWGRSYAVNYGQYRGSDQYTIGQSYGWSLSPQ